MSANLDKALDEIIDSQKKPVRRPNKNAPRKVAKSVTAGRRRGPAAGVRKSVPVERATSMLEAAYATKVNVEGLPRDIKEDAVRVC